ncbi:MAG: MBL fold metallo-hydrolase [Deltaproteobacteria bacterium]|nr:MBL fold metallo-hydrolase [Deltaproteobacteria bacterium]
MLALQRLVAAITVAALAGCATSKPPPAPELSPASWSVDRESLPEGTLRMVQVATTASPGNLVVQGAPNRRVELPVYVYVFEHPAQGVTLIDTGFGRRTAADSEAYPGKRMTNLLSLTMTEGAALADRLPEAGLATEDVAHVVLTHMHPDHVGGLEDFPEATLHIASSEWTTRLDGSALGSIDPSPFEGHANVTEFTWTETPVGPFAQTVDLFGDGSLIALSTPGHTPGHTSFLVNLPGGSYLITGDAAWVDPHWQAPAMKSPLVRSLLEHDWQANWESQWRIRRFAMDHIHLVVLSGHDAKNAERLPVWPEATR